MIVNKLICRGNEYDPERIGKQMLELLKWQGFEKASLAVQKANYAVNEMLRHAFEDCGKQKVWIGYYEGNAKSKRVQEK